MKTTNLSNTFKDCKIWVFAAVNSKEQNIYKLEKPQTTILEWKRVNLPIRFVSLQDNGFVEINLYPEPFRSPIIMQLEQLIKLTHIKK